MKSIILNSLLFVSILANSCTKESPITGKYEVVSKTMNDYLFLREMNSKGRIIGSKLDLMADSTFLYYTCGNEMRGYWRKSNESILLFVSANTYRSDSLRSVKEAEIPKEAIVFQIHKKQLYRQWLRESKDSSITVELLTKIN